MVKFVQKKKLTPLQLVPGEYAKPFLYISNATVQFTFSTLKKLSNFQSRMLLKYGLINFACKAAILNITALKFSIIVLLEKRQTLQPFLYCSNAFVIFN